MPDCRHVVNAGPFRSAAELYWQAGWKGCLPLPARAKRDPPRGYTGAEGIFPSWPDVQAWLDNGVADGNICLRMPDDVIGIDVDMYDGKQGRATLAELEAKWGPLPDTWMSSSRDDGSGIRFYRVPAGRKWPSVPGPGIEIIQHGHRYAVVWPSVHPNGATYRWMTLDGLAVDHVPQVVAMSPLPARWVDGLSSHTTTASASGWTDPDLDALVEHGIPAGVNQDEALRDVVWKLRRDGLAHEAAKVVWIFIAGKTKQLDPNWAWSVKDFERHWKGADAKLPAPLTVLDAPQRGPDEEELPKTGPFVNVAALLSEGLPEGPAPVVLRRADGVALFYAEKVNVLFGDPECGKTWIAYAAAVESLAAGKKVTIIDADHNGAVDILARLVALGAMGDVLGDMDRFRLAEPEDKAELGAVIEALRLWRPDLAIVDSIGEILPMLGLSSNSPDDYTTANRVVLTALARSGACVIGIDHLPKSDEARSHGQTGTLAKKRTIGGVSLKVTLREVFSPGRGGSAGLTIHKDRPGNLRARCPVDGKWQPAGIFKMTDELDGRISYSVSTPTLGDDSNVSLDDIAELDGMVPPPSSVRDVKDRLKWGGDRASSALRAWKARRT